MTLAEIARTAYFAAERASINERMLDACEALEPECRAAVAGGRAFSGHMLAWVTPAGAGITGKPLYLVDGRWYFTLRPAPGGIPGYASGGWASVAEHISGWRRPLDSARQVVERITGQVITTSVDVAFGRGGPS